MGSADFVHRDFFEEIDASKSLIDAIPASTVRGVRVPPVVETDRAGLIASLSTIGVVDPASVHVLRITDTMYLDRLSASEALVAEARTRDDLRVSEEPAPIAFEDGKFVDESPVLE